MLLVLWVGAFSVGGAVALQAPVAAATVAVLAPLAACIAHILSRRRHTLWAQMLVAWWFGSFAGARALQPPVLPPAIAAVLDTDEPVRVQGWVLTAPERSGPPDGDGSRLRVVIERVSDTPARVTVALAVASGTPTVMPGDAVEFGTRLRGVRGLANPGLPDTALALRAGGIDVLAGVGTAAAVRRLSEGEVTFGRDGGIFLWRAASRARLALGRALDGVARGSAGAFLHTAVLGERRGTDARVEDGFRAAGATHVLSVSGLHLAAVGMVFFGGVRRLLMMVPRLPLWVDPRRVAALVGLPAIAFYTLITGDAVATVRAAVMMGFGLLGLALGRRNTPLVAVAAAVLALLAWSPLVLIDVSFQLSVVSVLSLGILMPRLISPARGGGQGDQLSGRRRTFRWLARPARFLAGLLAASAAAGMTTAPIVAHHFGEVTPAAPLGNMMLVPLVELVVVPAGLLGAALAATVGTGAGFPLLKVAEGGAWLALWLAERFRIGAPVWLTRAPNVAETVSLCAGVACLLAAVRSGTRARRVTARAGAALVGIAAVSLVGREIARRRDPHLVITFLDVGQGDAAVVQIPGGATVLIDGGGTYDGAFDPGARIVEPFLRAQGITRLDAVVLSHPHPDHLGGLHRILARFPVARLWTSGDDGRNPDYWRLMAAARERAIATPVPSEWRIADVELEPLGPFVGDGTGTGAGAGEHIGVPEGTTVNDASLVIRVRFGRRAVLFTGDIEANGEGELAGRTAAGQAVASDVLKVPHHGSRTSSTDELLDVVHPGLAIASLGWHNRFHFPRPEVEQRYAQRGIRLLRTDRDGAVTVRVGPQGELDATCARGCR